MPTNFISGGSAAVTVANGDTTILRTGAERYVVGDAITLSAGVITTKFFNHGSVLSDAETIKILDTNSILVNHGVIEGAVDAIDLGAGSHEITNYGRISSGQEVIDISASAPINITLQNFGEMVSFGNSEILDNDLDLVNGTVVNTGYMSGTSLYLNGSGFSSLSNSGTIMSSLVSMASALGAAFTNTGTIVDINGPNSTILQTSAIGDTVVNSGSMTGSVALGSGADSFRMLGEGFVSGSINGQTGDDTILGGSNNDFLSGGSDNDLLAGNDGNDTILGDGGNDTVFAGSGEDSVEGGTGSDRLNAGTGDDTVLGGSENDTLAGQDGDDFLDGEAGSDVVDGGSGNDSLFGGDGNDILRGRSGTDVLTGGQGLDVLTGGEDADIFLYEALSDSTANANRDVILDFEKGVDEINLVNVVPGVFAFRGTAGFTASGGAELRLQETATGSTIVRMDADGNGTTDMEINIAGVTGLTVDDFVL